MTGNGQPSVSRVLGNYELLTRIGSGGMCEVFQGRHRETGQIVAVKILPERTARNETLMRRFEQEFRVARRLEHPNIVRALDFCDNLPTPILVMEFVEGESLGERVERQGPLPEAEAVRLLVQVCQALQYAHDLGIIHRDIKPDNLLLTAAGEVKITDFGLVKELLFDQGLTRTGRGLGTPHYMAPEQFRNARSADTRADVYSLGATLYTLVTGTLPFAGNSLLEAWTKKMEARLISPRSLVPALSSRTEQAIVHAMEGPPERRPSSCLELIQELTGEAPEGPMSHPAPLQQLWYVRYENQEGQQYLLCQPLSKIRQCLESGLFSNVLAIRVSPSEKGPFQPLDHHEAFRDLTRTAAPAPAAPPRSSPARNPAAPPTGPAAPARSNSGPVREWLTWGGLVLLALAAGWFANQFLFR